jgi:hypothetical protein
VTSVPCQVVRSTTQVYFNIRIDQKRRRAIHFCEQCRYYGRYCDAIHKGRKKKYIYISKDLFFIICLSESDNKKRTIKTTHIFESIQASVDLFRHHWHVYRYHRKFPNHISILFLKNVIQLIKYSNIFNNKFDKNLPIQRLYGHLNHIQ